MSKNELRITLRQRITDTDFKSFQKILKSATLFSKKDLAVAADVIKERLCKGKRSGYNFLLAQNKKEIIGFTCFGPVPLTDFSYDIYWIVVRKDVQRLGIGKLLLKQSEAIIKKSGGTNIYIETSSKKQYKGTRMFYERYRYNQQVILKDFYTLGEDKIIYSKILKTVNKEKRPAC